jgi:hypothetical protein
MFGSDPWLTVPLDVLKLTEMVWLTPVGFTMPTEVTSPEELSNGTRMRVVVAAARAVPSWSGCPEVRKVKMT